MRIRPFDFYVAFLVFIMGLYGIIDPAWPPLDMEPWVSIILIVEDFYLAAAGLAIMLALGFRDLFPKTSFIVEQFGWIFVASASAVITLTSYWVPPSIFTPAYPGVDDHLMLFIWIFIWAGLGIASFIRYVSMKAWLKHGA